MMILESDFQRRLADPRLPDELEMVSLRRHDDRDGIQTMETDGSVELEEYPESVMFMVRFLSTEWNWKIQFGQE